MAFHRMAQALYSRPTLAVLVRDRVSEAFIVCNGVRKRDHISPALYVLAFEPSPQWLCCDIRIGSLLLPLGSSPITLFAYADDLFIVIPR